MYNTCVSSTVYSIRSNGPLSHCFNERPIFLNERCNGNRFHPSSSSSLCCSCCVCYTFPTQRVPVGPSIFYGPRQSTLLQWSISRRLMLGGRNRFCYTLPEYGRVLDCYEVPFSISDGGTCHCSEGRRYRRSCMISDSDCEFDKSHGFDEEDIAEAMISLIREGFGSQERIKTSKRVEVGNQRKCGAKEGNLSSSRRVELEKKMRRGVEEKRFSSFEKIRVDKKRESNSQQEREERKSNKFDSLNSKHNNKVGSMAVELRKDGYRLNSDQLVNSRADSQSLRKEGSTCSSYYSLSSTGDIESDAEVEDKNVQFVEESSSGYRYESVSDVGEKLDGQIKEAFKRQAENEKRREEESVVRDPTVGNSADWHLRKNSDNKLKMLTTVTSSVSGTSDMNSRLSRARESGYACTSSPKKKFVDKKEESKMAVTLNEQSKQYDVSGKKVGGVFINEGKKLAEVSEISHSSAEEISHSHKRLTIKNENLELDANLIKKASNNNHGTGRPVLQEKSSRRSSSFQQLLGVSENRRTERESISHQTSQSDASESTGLHVTSNQKAEEEHHQIGNHPTGEVDSRQKFLHLGVISVIKEGNTNISSSEIRTQNEEQNAALVNASNFVAKDIKSSTDQKDSQRVMSRKGSRDASDISMVHGTDKISATHSEKTFESRIFKQETNKSLVEKTVKETIIRRGQNNNRLVQTESGKEAKNHVEKSEVQGSINLSSQSSYQGIGLNNEENKRSQAVLMPPPSQLVAREPLRIDSTSEMASQVVSRRTSGSSSGASYMQPGGSPALDRTSYRGSGADESIEDSVYLITPDDTLGSADRLERSSAQFVGEFIEKSRDELLISEIHKEKNISEVDLLHEEKHGEHNLVDYRMKDHDSRLSSGSSGTKGPSDEMWHVMDSTTEQPPKTDDPEISAHSENAIVKRSGKSLWNVISDIVRLRWNSRAETSESALRSGGRNSPNESVSNETWFSGREHEETDNKKMERTTVSEFTYLDQLEEPNLSAQGQDLSDDKTAKSIYSEVDNTSFPNIMETKPSGGTLLVSGEAILTDGRKVDVISSGLDIEQSSLPLSTQGIRGSSIQEMFRSGKTDAFASSSADQLGHSSDATLSDISTTGTKDVEVKQRKLQRNKQVLKDRFDEWEEAYLLETEQRKIDEIFMREALAEAKKAADTWEVPVGAVLVKHGKIIARGCNLVEELRDSTAHAEMICIREASKQLKTWRLADTTLYVTLEPCPMCAGAILQARIENLVWGAPNKLLGADGSWIRLFPDGGEGNVSEQSEKSAAPVHPFHPKMTIRRGVLGSECADVMQQFFQLRRRKKQKKENTPPLAITHHPSKFITKMHNIFHILFCL
ncbi:tRNA(adenine(34)) deaminase, chloroplastic [Benincasa hispida]|uniref:tRNA(adenine(34)) deaminase, chloroplastic n=1 Tax=Benincasa hispida TaxID=102211 RepID=UPI001900F182|nr:tRNA(adenine(34)) deaminase, chloroplastic [Benincasa hispida]